MKLTLWLLNRITQWEVDRKGELGEALGASRHDVLLGRRVLSKTPPEPGTLALEVNHTQPSFRGELMHEGHQQTVDGVPNAYDEYFMPIPLKCLGKPNYDSNGDPQLTAFWKELIIPAKQAEFLRILAPQVSENH